MSTEGTSTERIYEEEYIPTDFLTIDYPGVALIKDGQIKIVLRDLKLVIKAKVRGTKGQGVADADNLHKANDNHYEIIAAIQAFPKEQRFSTEFIMDTIDQNRKNKGLEPIDRNAFRRPISELLRKNVICPVFENARFYVRNDEMIQHVLETGKF